MIIKKIFSTNQLLKSISLIFGYWFWLIFAKTQQINTTNQIPLCFYNLKENLQISAPETIKVSLQGKRIDFCEQCNAKNISFQIDASKFESPGNYEHNLAETELLLHNKIKLLNYVPSTITIEIRENK